MSDQHRSRPAENTFAAGIFSHLPTENPAPTASSSPPRSPFAVPDPDNVEDGQPG